MITANPLPKAISDAAVIPYNNSFLLIGGETDSLDSYFLTDVYQYNSVDDSWILLDAELKTARSGHVALLVERSLFPECD